VLQKTSGQPSAISHQPPAASRQPPAASVRFADARQAADPSTESNQVKIVPTTSLTLMLTLLAGCAGVTTAVESHGAMPAVEATHAAHASYRLARTPAQQASSKAPPYEALLREGLARRGFVPAANDDEHANYLVSVAWSTQPADVGVAADDCRHDCLPSTGPGFPWFGRRYVHQMTLRFFSLPDGHNVYKVTSVKRDHDADACQALPALVASALAKLPEQGGPQWRVRVEDARPDGALPGVLSVRPVTR